MVENTPSQEVDTSSVKCPSCGGSMTFNPETQKLYCSHCGNEVDIESLEVSEQDLSSVLFNGDKWQDDTISAFSCENCGAKVVLDKSETAKSCPFCGTSHVKKIEELVGLKPNGLLPFSFNDDKALEYSRFWAKRRFFAPRKFKKNLTHDNIKGIYTPCFTFDSETFSQYEGRLGRTKTRTVGSGKNRRTETYVEWFNVAGTYSHKFDDVLLSAGEKIEQKKLDKIAPFDTNNSKKYEEKFLLGYGAYHYDKKIGDCWQSAKKVMDDALTVKILSKYSYDRVAYLNVSTKHTNVTYKYVMLPVYVGNYKYKDKLYNFYVNGCTGKTFGKFPKSVFKIILAVLVGLLVLGGFIYLIQFANF